jgi:hypothetical protein
VTAFVVLRHGGVLRPSHVERARRRHDGVGRTARLLVEAARLHIEADLALLDEVERVADEQGRRPVGSREAPSSADDGQARRRAVS